MVIRFKGLSIVGGRTIVSNATSYIITSTGAKLTDTRSTAWTNEVSHTFSVTWNSETERTNFFNNGGQIRMSGERVGGTSSAQNDSWTKLFDEVGTVTFDINGTDNTGKIGTGSAFTVNTLTSTYQTIFSANSNFGTYYFTDQYTIEARKTATIIEFKITHSDALDGSGDESVDGDIYSYIDERRYTGDSSPTYTSLTSMVSGS